MAVRVAKPVGGFTLVELLVSLMLASFITAATVGALRNVSSRRKKLEDRAQTMAELRFAARQIEQDLRNLYRSNDIRQTKLIGTYEDRGDVPSSRIVFYTVNTVKARAEYAEGDLYEVEYFLKERDERSRTGKPESTVLLMRRLRPNPDNRNKLGGILSVAAEHIAMLDIRYYDGSEWQEEWPKGMTRLPSLIMVTLAARRHDSKVLLKHSFLVNFVRWPGQGQSSVNIGLDGRRGDGN